MFPITVLFVGETWNGSSARSMRDAIALDDMVQIDDIGEDHYYPKGRSLIIRCINRVLKPLYQRELSAEIIRRCQVLHPDVVIVYKGNLVPLSTISILQSMGIKVVNVYPDYSPNAFGLSLCKAMGQYDLVISTKPFHPNHWHTTYGYENPCVCVPHGYDPKVHFWPGPAESQDIDVVLAASWRPQYENLMAEVGRMMPNSVISVALAGPGWSHHRDKFPLHWQFPGPLFGRAYGDFLRRGKIVIAPVHTDVVIDGQRQPGDEDTTRTYELAAASTFFLHRRTPYVKTVYREDVEAVFWDDAEELVEKIKYYLPKEAQRKQIALAAHKRAVPEYSIPARARLVIQHVMNLVEKRQNGTI